MVYNEVIKRILTMGAARGLTTPRAISIRAGLGPEYMRGLIARNAIPKMDSLKKIADAYDCTTNELLYDATSDLETETLKLTRPQAASLSSSQYLGVRDIPVMGLASGAVIEGAEGFIIGSDPIEYVPRPPGMMGMIAAYAIFVHGTSMIPAHPPGQLRYVNPHRPFAPDDSVIVQTRRYDTDPGQAYIKIYRRQNAEKFVFEMLNPVGTIEIPRQFIVSVHKVLTMNEIMGV